jgi:hypothetical protein
VIPEASSNTTILKETPHMLRIFAILIALFSSPTLFAEHLPDGYDKWIPVMQDTCGKLKFEIRRTITLNEEREALVMWWDDTLINVTVESTGEAGNTSATEGLYEGNWTKVEITDEQTSRRSDRLIEASILQAGGQSGMDALQTCRENITKRALEEFVDGLQQGPQELEGLGDALND